MAERKKITKVENGIKYEQYEGDDLWLVVKDKK